MNCTNANAKIVISDIRCISLGVFFLTGLGVDVIIITKDIHSLIWSLETMQCHMSMSLQLFWEMLRTGALCL